MKLTKEQKDQIAEKLSSPYGGAVKLMCDGYQVTLSVERASALTYRVMTYVNGYFKGQWCNPANEVPEQKFLRKLVNPLCSPAKKREAEKALGKRFVKNSSYYNATLTSYWPDWSSGKAAINHLCKVCESVQFAE